LTQIVRLLFAIGPGHPQQDQQPPADAADFLAFDADRRFAHPLDHGTHIFLLLSGVAAI
jgi:hypothetical protein